MTASLGPLESAADEAIRTWPEVRVRSVFGHRGYLRGSKMFAFVAEGGLSFKAASTADAEELYEAGEATPFVYNGSMEMRAWPVVPLAIDEQLADALSAARDAYERLG